MSLSAAEQKLLDFALAALPSWYQDSNRSFEFESGAAKMAQDAMDKVTDWLVTQARLSTATGATSTEPDWLGQHAVDRGTSRFDGETDTSLAARLKTVPNALTIPSIDEAINTVLSAAGITSAANLVELRQQRIFFSNERSYPSGTSYEVGGTFATTAIANQFAFTPSAAWDGSYAPVKDVQEIRGGILVVVQSAAAGNIGSFPITGLDGDAILFTNASGVAEVTSTVQWCIDPTDMDGNRRAIYNIDAGKNSSYLSRGYRLGKDRAKIIALLPEGADDGVINSTTELMRLKKAAGVATAVEAKKAYGSITYVGGAYGSNLGASFTVSVPASIADGDFLLLATFGEIGNTTDMWVSTTPTLWKKLDGGWQLPSAAMREIEAITSARFANFIDGATETSVAQLFYRFWTSSEALDYVIVNGDIGGYGAAALVVYRGVNQTKPIIDLQVYFTGESGNQVYATTPPYTMGGVHTEYEAMVVGMFAQYPAEAVNTDASYTTRLSAAPTDFTFIIGDLATSAGYVDGMALTGSATATGWGVTLALKPEEA